MTPEVFLFQTTPEVFLFQTTPEVSLFQTTPEVSPKDEVSNMKLIWHGTASVEIISGQNSTPSRILFDPFVPLAGSDVPVKIEDYDVVAVGSGKIFRR